MIEQFFFFPVASCAPRIGKDVLCKFKNGNFMVCRYEARDGKPVFAIPPGWFAAENAFWPADSVEAFAFLPSDMLREVHSIDQSDPGQSEGVAHA